MDSEYNLDELVQAIVDYLDYHFRDEEKIMASMNYPRLKEHIAMHHAFEDYFKEVGAKIHSEVFDNRLLIELQDKVVNWLLDHIAKIDKQYGMFRVEQGLPEHQ